MNAEMHYVGYIFLMLAIIVFSIVLRDLLLMRAERIERDRELERLRTEAHEAEYAQDSVSSMLD